ncbi:MAG: TGS domain-containing protein [Solirubrobacteraceae bacterium]
MTITVTLPDRNTLELPDGASGADVAGAIGPGLRRAALAIEVDGVVQDLAQPVADSAAVSILTQKSDGALALIRHDAAHVLATAVTELYPGVKVSIGPAIENGFYYDFDFPEGVSVGEDDLPTIEARMAEHIRAA